MKVCILPGLAEFKSTVGGVPRVIADLTKYLPEMGIEVVANPDDADIIHCHAVAEHPHIDVYTNHAYWRYPQSDWEKTAVIRMNQNIVRAKIVTSVSGWTPQLYEEELGVKARVIYNGVSLNSLRRTPKGRILKEYGLKKPYFLWAKNLIRRYDACKAAVDLAIALPEYPFIMTLIPHGIELPPNIIVTGTVPYKRMKLLLRDCFALIATEKECFSVMNIEALAMGKPIIGWNHGGTPEVVEDQVNGCLVPVGEPLISCIPSLLKHYEEWSKNAWEMAAQYDLKQVILPQYIECYNEIINSRSKFVATIIITCYNKQHFIEKAVTSALSQDFDLPFEVIVLDDCSTDGSRLVLKSLRAKFPKLQVVFNEKNVNVGPTRNKGIEIAQGEYIVCLDGDDWIEPNLLSKLYPTIKADCNIGIAYSDWELFGKGYSVIHEAHEWDYNNLLHRNYITCCCMFRKEAWKKAGKYHNLGGWEDYDLWLGIGGKGYKGVRVPEVLFHYFEEMGNRAFRSALNGNNLRRILHSLHPDYIGPTAEAIQETEKYLKGRQEGIDIQKIEDKVETGSVQIESVQIESVLESVPLPIPDPVPILVIAQSALPKLRYLGAYRATVILHGAVTHRRYKFSQSIPEFEVDERDIGGLLAKIGWFERVV